MLKIVKSKQNHHQNLNLRLKQLAGNPMSSKSLCDIRKYLHH